MKIHRGDWFEYRKSHKLKEEYKKEMALDLFDICFDMDRTKDFTNRGEFSTGKYLLTEKMPLISDNYLIDLCNECLSYDNLSALNVLIAEVAKRNAEREDGNRILFYKETKNE